MKILILFFLLSQSIYAQPLYDTRGDRGRPAVPGSHGVGAGAHGGHAIDATDAKDSGIINLDLEEVTSSDRKVEFKISSDLRNPDGSIKSQLEHLFEVDKNGIIVKDHTGVTDHLQSIKADSSGVTAHGGANGGNGRKGYTGTRGRHATRHTNGGNGGTGGPGGNAGAGSLPGQSGNAADTNLNIINEDQTHLLMHIDEDTPGLLDGVIEGGKETHPGVHGQVGAGGDGGPGGRSHSWTTTTRESRSVSDGKGGTKN